jgi:hypothetical protein
MRSGWVRSYGHRIKAPLRSMEDDDEQEVEEATTPKAKAASAR